MRKAPEEAGCLIEGGREHASRRCWLGVRTLCGGILLHVALGTVYSMGVTSLYFISYIRKQQELQGVVELVRSSSASDLTAAAFCTMAISMPLGGLLQRKLGPAW